MLNIWTWLHLGGLFMLWYQKIFEIIVGLSRNQLILSNDRFGDVVFNGKNIVMLFKWWSMGTHGQTNWKFRLKHFENYDLRWGQ